MLADAYNQAMDRINRQKPGFRELATKVLSWITCAKRPLTTSELRCALAIKVGKSKLDQGDLLQLGDVVSVCAGLVTVDEESHIIRLVHYTAQEYFERTWAFWFPDAQRNVSMTCLTYLSFDCFAAGFCSTKDEFKTRIPRSDLYDYATLYWGYHARAALNIDDFMEWESTKDIFFLNEEKERVWLERYATLTNSCVPQPGSDWILHVAAYTGITEFVRGVVNIVSDINAMDKYGRTALHWAARNGHENIADLLLNSGANVDARGK